ncbi:hypothetical protein MAR_023388 [Mya arenaria]|uniref:Uncharacterized protein n=1 Tax=Mya arenaria TaxID=6604 RepID=A0ABY7DQS1_MYAAR|nr:hypothetical protein MAR_023388 [Mya arenaria]
MPTNNRKPLPRMPIVPIMFFSQIIGGNTLGTYMKNLFQEACLGTDVMNISYNESELPQKHCSAGLQTVFNRIEKEPKRHAAAADGSNYNAADIVSIFY